jgi:hypothetical protein
MSDPPNVQGDASQTVDELSCTQRVERLKEGEEQLARTTLLQLWVLHVSPDDPGLTESPATRCEMDFLLVIRTSIFFHRHNSSMAGQPTEHQHSTVDPTLLGKYNVAYALVYHP